MAVQGKNGEPDYTPFQLVNLSCAVLMRLCDYVLLSLLVNFFRKIPFTLSLQGVKFFIDC